MCVKVQTTFYNSHVFYCGRETDEANVLPVFKSIIIPGAQPASFQVVDYDYAKDARQVYYKSKILTNNVEGFTVLKYGYAKTNTEVYYMGDTISKAEAGSFMILDSLTEKADAKDNLNEYLQGKKQ